MYYNKFNMSVEENIFVAKRNLVDYIYKSARLEGLGVTFPDTEAIVNGGKIQGLSSDEIVAVNNLKHAWQFVLDNTEYPTEYPLICEINRIVGANLFYNAGMIRNIPVSVGGTDWKPPLPIEVDIKDDIKAALGIENTTERSIALMLLIMRRQIFIDGNKRTAMLAANHQMIQNGNGIISIPAECVTEFSKKLIAYYNSGSMEDIKQYVFDVAIDGLEMEKMRVNESTQHTYSDWKAKIDEERAADRGRSLEIHQSE
jgi:hypothetical protein